MYSLMCVLRTSVHTHTHTKAYLSPQVCGSASARVCVNFGGWHGADSQMEKFAACEHVSGQIKKKKKKKRKLLIKTERDSGLHQGSRVQTHTRPLCRVSEANRRLQPGSFSSLWAPTGPSPPRTGGGGVCLHLVPDLSLLALSADRRTAVCGAFRETATAAATDSRCPPASLWVSNWALHAGPCCRERQKNLIKVIKKKNKHPEAEPSGGGLR